MGVGVAVLNRKPAISLKRGKIGPRLLWMTNRKLHTRFRLVLKSMTSDDPERPFRTLFQNACIFGAQHENFNDVGQYYQRQRCSAMTVVSGNIRFMRIFAGVPWRRGVKRQYGNRKRRSSGLSDATSSPP